MDTLLRAFSGRFSCEPVLAVSAPGRVNLIGEHTDYNGLPVFPMAIQRQIRLVLRPRNDAVVRLANTDPQFPPREFEISRAIPSRPPGDWANYAQASAQMLASLHGRLRGFDAACSGDVPPSAGLGSSSALVVASGLALLAANGIPVNSMALMPVFAEAEYYVGTRGGGMDQAISLGGRCGEAVKIDFAPMRLTNVPVPGGWQFLIAHSLVLADKSGSVREHYNARPRESREAVARLGAKLGASSYRGLLERYPVEELIEAASRLEDPFDRRFRHLVSEATRVEQAVEAMRCGDLFRFGSLMNASHVSMRDDYEISSPALDELTETAVRHGAAGARLTGAGFGGCAVLLVQRDRVGDLIEALEADYYARRPERARFPDYLLAAEPSDGALVRFL